MPEGTPYSSFIRPYPIRVDEFRDNLKPSDPIPALHLLTHTHTDHLPGLNAASFGSIIICSVDAKEMLLRHESWTARTNFENHAVVEKERTYAHLKSNIRMRVGEFIHTANRDLLRPLPLHTPTRYQLSNDDWVTVTLLDANHCPGAVMFLVEGCQGSVLHTGDFRCEPAFVARLAKNPFVQRYIPLQDPSKPDCYTEPLQRLDTVYIDTENLLANYRVLPKDEATSSLIEIIKKLPSDRRFYINAWTWGYEDILKAIALAFNTKIHVDRYKYDIYTSIHDCALASLITRDPENTRFHACERFDRCSRIRPDDPRVIYINPTKMSTDRWAQYHTDLTTELQRGEVPQLLLVPFSRHSPLPELQDFVRLFRPKRVIPNSLQPELCGMDWACMPTMFSSCLSDGGAAARMREDLRLAGVLDNAFMGIAEDAVLDDPATEYLVGNNAAAVVARWASEPGFFFDGGRVEAKIRVMQGFLPGGLRLLAERAVRAGRMEKLARERPMLVESDEGDSSSQSQEDGRGRTADFLFGADWEVSSGSSSAAAALRSPGVKREVLSSPKEKAVVAPSAVCSTAIMAVSGPLKDGFVEASVVSVSSGLRTPPPTLPDKRFIANSPRKEKPKFEDGEKEEEEENSDPRSREYAFTYCAVDNNNNNNNVLLSESDCVEDRLSLSTSKPIKPPFLDLRNLHLPRKSDSNAPSLSPCRKRRKISAGIDPSASCASPHTPRESRKVSQEDRSSNSKPQHREIYPTASFPTAECLFDKMPAGGAMVSQSVEISGCAQRRFKRKYELEREIITRKLLLVRPDLNVSQCIVDCVDSGSDLSRSRWTSAGL